VVLPDAGALEKALQQLRRMQAPRPVGVGSEGTPCKPTVVILREWNGYQKKRQPLNGELNGAWNGELNGELNGVSAFELLSASF
jgi:hypothetical protein